MQKATHVEAGLNIGGTCQISPIADPVFCYFSVFSCMQLLLIFFAGILERLDFFFYFSVVVVISSQLHVYLNFQY